MPDATTHSALLEARLLGGPNLYFPRPAVRLAFDVSGMASLDEASLLRIARRLGVRTQFPGAPGTQMRQRCLLRVVIALTRTVARRGGNSRLAVRARAGERPDELVVAIPWVHEGKVDALAHGLASVLAALHNPASLDAALVAAGDELASAPLGHAPRPIEPTIPTIAVTGTNGKTTTSRMIAHIARLAGMDVAWSSTEGVVHNDVVVARGDYSGPGGAREVFACNPQLAVLETARGGILRRGLGVTCNDVSVVTNVAADHLGLGGIDTLDQLAEVKAVVPSVTRPIGWAVLNGDDPRVFGMRHLTKARCWAFSVDPNSPALRVSLDAGGRATTLLDGVVCVLQALRDPVPIVPIADPPMTLFGLSRPNVENVLGVCSAALALGFSVEQVRDGVMDFDPQRDNPGRMGVWFYGDPAVATPRVVVIDMAHNEAGIETLIEIISHLRAPGGRLSMVIGAAGDRGNDVLEKLGERAGIASDAVWITHTDQYLRGRDKADLEAHLRRGIERSGTSLAGVRDDEVAALVAALAAAAPGEVIGFMAHQDRDQMIAWLIEQGARPASHDDIGVLVRAARAGQQTD